MNYCLECNQNITTGIEEYSISNYGIPLCINHQNWADFMSKHTTFETLRLYFELKKRGVPAQIEKFDGYKHIDISIPEAKVNIEVDGQHHNFDNKQALSDLKRTYHSFINGYFTLRIPNSLVYNYQVLSETADYIVALLNENKRKNT